MKKNWISIITVLVLIGLGGYFLFSQSSNEKSTEQSLELFPGVDWVETTSAPLVDPLGGDAGMSGKSWEGALENLAEEDLATIGFREYYTEKLSREGWAEQVEYGGFTIGPIAADGPYSSARGYLKVDEGMLKIVAFSMETTGEQTSGENEPIVYGPPYKVTLGIFVSDPIPLGTPAPNDGV
ncbi:hypothetical protein KKH05_01070 [Patescibacteria group bacterium]|nr:hypothetical protein [Patescibacteria group bacterium]